MVEFFISTMAFATIYQRYAPVKVSVKYDTKMWQQQDEENGREREKKETDEYVKKLFNSLTHSSYFIVNADANMLEE